MWYGPKLKRPQTGLPYFNYLIFNARQGDGNASTDTQYQLLNRGTELTQNYRFSNLNRLTLIKRLPDFSHTARRMSTWTFVDTASGGDEGKGE